MIENDDESILRMNAGNVVKEIRVEVKCDKSSEHGGNMAVYGDKTAWN